jgi:signal transduction histidine kinase
MKIISLGEKLILYFVMLGIGAIAIISSVAFYSTKEALISRTFDQLTSLRLVKKNQIEKFYADRMRDISFLSGTEYFTQNPSPRRSDFSTGKTGRIEFKDHLLGQYFTAFYIYGNEGIVNKGFFNDTTGSFPPALSSGMISQLRSGLKSQAVVNCDESIDRQTGKPYQLIATEITNQMAGKKSPRHILVLSISIDAINAIMLNNDPLSGLGLSGETYLVGPDFLMRSTSRFQPGSILKTYVKTRPVKEAMTGKSGAIITNDYRSVPVLSSYGSVGVPGLNWMILAEIDVSEAMVPIYETRTRMLLLSVLILVVFFGFVFFISRRMTKPLIRLRDATINLGEGLYNMDLPVTTRDEIGALTVAFNVMARQIKEKTTELQKERFGRMRSVFDGEEMERQRLSRELHDGIGQSLIAIKLRLENLLYQDGKEVRHSIQELKNYFDQIIDEVRRMSNNLMPSVLEVFSIPIAFRNLFTETEDHSHLRIYFEANGDFDDLDKKIKTYIYRLTQEALNNIVKHADAREVRVNLTRYPDHLTLVIRDDGIGFLPENIGKEGGNGIHNMRERASLLQGQIEIRSTLSKGTTITLNVPIISAYVKNQDFPRG